jgi:hypothetical protein
MRVIPYLLSPVVVLNAGQVFLQAVFTKLTYRSYGPLSIDVATALEREERRSVRVSRQG